MYFGKKPELKPGHKKLLQNLKIDDTNPGTLLHDFQVMIDIFHEQQRKLTASQQIPLSLIREINPRLKNPMDVRLQRSQQNSYPRIEGLYLLLRASGLTSVRTKGKTSRLEFGEEWLKQWNQFNPTEKYCHLLEAWMIRGYEEILGGRSSAFDIPRVLDKTLSYFMKMPPTGVKITSYKHFRDEFKYYPETYNLALMDLFGMVKIHEGKPVDGEGWQVEKVVPLEVGDALLSVLFDILYIKRYEGLFSEENEEFDFEDIHEEDNEQANQFSVLKTDLQEYFPAWQKTIELTQREKTPGQYIFKVSLRHYDWSAKIAMDSMETLDDLAWMIISAAGFDNDHLYEFRLKTRFGSTVEISHPYANGQLFTDEITPGNIHLKEGSKMEFIFDFGDWWEFDIVVEEHNPDKKQPESQVISTTGEAPEQYPNWDEEE